MQVSDFIAHQTCMLPLPIDISLQASGRASLTSRSPSVGYLIVKLPNDRRIDISAVLESRCVYVNSRQRAVALNLPSSVDDNNFPRQTGFDDHPIRPRAPIMLPPGARLQSAREACSFLASLRQNPAQATRPDLGQPGAWSDPAMDSRPTPDFCC